MPADPKDVIFEFRQIGAYMKVSAIDPLTLIEVSISGPASAAKHDLQRLALNKLKRAIERNTN